MDNEQLDYFFGIPPVFVRNLTAENIKRVLTAIVIDDGGRRLEVYGSLQKQSRA